MLEDAFKALLTVLGLMGEALEFGVSGFWVCGLGSGFGVLVFGSWVLVFGSWVRGFGFWVWVWG